ncbi:immunity 17 family protein [Aureibaculum sp. A20]|uniref:Immunity 17 family protein n=1 Tax=Aureibaculum flavum TaxID=2795986 RepID=A0ABS0WMU4_9FLAO|nr:Imm17 family immunity protein [Aureibaculum flavum]MBJ2173297.1 immunity 17 family protein [Aureibaculum flavum]
MTSFKPHYVYLLITFFLIIYLIAIIRKKDWVLFAGSGKYNFDYFIKIVGKTTVRLFIGFLSILGIVASFSAFYYHQNKDNNDKTINNIKENSEGVINQFNNFISLNPHYSYLLVAAGFGIFFLGFLFRWNWVLNPQGNHRMVRFHEIFGEENVRKIMIVITAIVTIICLGQFFNSN